MKYIDTIIADNKNAAGKKTIKRKSAKKKIITVAVQKVSTIYLKVYASTNDAAERIAKSWYTGDKNVDDKVVHKDGEPLEYLHGPTTYGYATEILGCKVEDMVDLSED